MAETTFARYLDRPAETLLSLENQSIPMRKIGCYAALAVLANHSRQTIFPDVSVEHPRSSFPCCVWPDFGGSASPEHLAPRSGQFSSLDIH